MSKSNFITGLVGGAVGAALILGGNAVFNHAVDSVNPTQNDVTKVDTQTLNIDTGVEKAVEKVKSAVVSVINLQAPQQSQDDVWGNLFGGENPGKKEDAKKTDLQPASEGSGVIYKKSGGKAFVVTNNHVVAENDGIEIQLSNGKKVTGTVVGTDPYSDLAVISIPDKDVKTVATFGDSSKLKVGEPAIAIGSPLGTEFANTVTSGIVSALARNVQNTNDQGQLTDINAIQTDAAINPGNSGGALVNIAGQVIGINSSKIGNSGSGTSVEGMGFAIPSSDVVKIINQLEKDGTIKRPAIGISSLALSDLTNKQIESLKLPKDITSGILIATVEKDWPAAKAGIEKYDVLTEVDGKKIDSVTSLQTILFSHKINDKVNVVFYRDGKKKNATLHLTKEYSKLPSSTTTTPEQQPGNSGNGSSGNGEGGNSWPW
ncbi:MAG: trypsin-like peptidase domain-containing protein [Streptococcaceae bacterium]|nr:trypsin-like peptidase domain-containing protein [Streptococcaceae bacterium]